MPFDTNADSAVIGLRNTSLAFATPQRRRESTDRRCSPPTRSSRQRLSSRHQSHDPSVQIPRRTTSRVQLATVSSARMIRCPWRSPLRRIRPPAAGSPAYPPTRNRGAAGPRTIPRWRPPSCRGRWRTEKVRVAAALRRPKEHRRKPSHARGSPSRAASRSRG